MNIDYRCHYDMFVTLISDQFSSFLRLQSSLQTAKQRSLFSTPNTKANGKDWPQDSNIIILLRF